jgi:hypothetical protein
MGDRTVGDLAKSVTRSLSAAIGLVLRRVVVRALDGEIADRAEFADPLLYVGGEVQLDFGVQSVFVSWAENEGWADHFSIGASGKSWFSPDTLRDWDVSDLDPWSRCTGKVLSGVRVFALAGTPHVVELSFDGHRFWVADGYQQRVGHGDDLLIRSGSVPELDGAKLVWSV